MDHLDSSRRGDSDSTASADLCLRTILVCDLVSSTALVEKLGDPDSLELLALHDLRARELIAAHGGREIDKSDGFLLLFERPRQAIEWALAYHRELDKLSRDHGCELRARVGIHLGEVFLRENPPEHVARGAKPLEVEGLAKPVAARVMALARGRQTLLTQGVYDLAQRSMADAEGLSWNRHGAYDLPGLVKAVEIYEVGESGVAPMTPPPGSRQAHRRLRLTAFLALVILVVGVWAWLGRTASESLEARPALAILGFRNGSGQAEHAWLSTALAELLTVELAATERLRLIPGESVSRMRLELALSEIDSLSDETLAAVRRNLGIDYVVVGSFLVMEEGADRQLVVSSVLQSAESGEILAASTADGGLNELLGLVSRTGAMLRADLGGGVISPSQARAIQATLSSSPEAAKRYYEGLEKLRRFDAQGARNVLEQAVAADPDYALAHVALSQAWESLGYDRRAAASAGKAFELRQGLPREEVLLIEGRYYQASVQHERAVESYQALWSFFPDDVEYGLLLAEAKWRSGLLREALETVEQLRQLPEPMGLDPRIDLVEAIVAYHLSDHQLELEAATRAARKGREQKARILVATAKFRQGVALFRLGRLAEAEPILDESQEMFAAVGDLGQAAQVLNALAVLVSNQGDSSRAEEIYEQALRILKGTGSRKWVSTLLNNQAYLLQDRGELAQATKMFEESLEIALEIDEPLRVPVRLRNLGLVGLKQGRLAEAREKALAALAAAEEIDRRREVAVSRYVLGCVALAAGRLDEARGHFDEAAAICEEINAKRVSAIVAHAQGELLALSGEIEEASRRFEEAETIRSELGEKGSVARSRLARAELRLAVGRYAEAEAMARTALPQFERSGWRDDEVLAQLVIGRSLLARGDLEDARPLLEATVELASKSQNVAVRLCGRLASARLDAALGRTSAARRTADEVRRQALESSMKEPELAARLFLGRLEGPAGVEALAELAVEARQAGYEWIACQAAGGEGC